MLIRRKLGQEEMAGFAIIIVLVVVILLAFLSASLKKPNKDPLENYEVANFLQSALQQTTGCDTGRGYIDVKDLIFECYAFETCENGVNSCTLLETTLRNMILRSWSVSGEDPLYSGYNMSVRFNEDSLLINSVAGGETAENKYIATQDFSRAGDDVFIEFTVWYEKIN